MAILCSYGAAAAFAQGLSGALSGTVDAAAQKARYDLQAARLVAAQRAVKSLEAAYAKQTADVVRLKKQRSSWRRDRELETALASSLEGAKALEAAQRAHTSQKRLVDTERAALLAAIKRELPLAGDDARRRLLAWQMAVAPSAPQRRIVLPDLSLDPYADPEDLLQQAAEIRQTEIELAREIALLESQAKRWAALAELRETEQRSSSVASLQGPDSRRLGGGSSFQRPSNSQEDPAEPAPPPPSNGPGGPEPSAVPPPASGGPQADSFADVASITAVLGSVLSSDLRKELEASELSRDPRARAKALLGAQRAAAAKLELFRKHRLLIEQRAAKNK